MRGPAGTVRGCDSMACDRQGQGPGKGEGAVDCHFQQVFFGFFNVMMMIAFITFKSSLVPLFEGL